MKAPLKLNKVLIPLLDHMLTTSISLPLEMLQAGITYSRLEKKQFKIDSILCAELAAPVTSTGGIRLTPDISFEQTGAGDLVIVPGLWRNPLPIAKHSKAFINWLQQQYENGATFCVIGTGVAFMAEAGLLDHKPAATHWYFLERLKQQYPTVDFKPHHLITRSGRIYCAGSVNSGADLMVHLIGLALGDSVAHKVEQQFSHEIRRPLEQILYAEDHRTSHRDEDIIELQEWIQAHFIEEISSVTLMQISGLTQRTLNRRFKEATGMSPVVYIQKLRLDLASELLKTTDLSVREVAMQSGYHDPVYFGRLFQKHFELTPSEFKRSVRGKLFYVNQ